MKKYSNICSLLSLLILSANPVFSAQPLDIKDSKITFSQRSLNENDLIEKFDLISGRINIDFNVEQEKLTTSTDFLIENSNNKEINKILFILNPGLNIENINQYL